MKAVGIPEHAEIVDAAIKEAADLKEAHPEKSELAAVMDVLAVKFGCEVSSFCVATLHILRTVLKNPQQKCTPELHICIQVCRSSKTIKSTSYFVDEVESGANLGAGYVLHLERLNLPKVPE